MTEVAVLGIDPGTTWARTGSAVLAFSRDAAGPRWTACEPGAIRWPEGEVTPRAVADAIDGAARALGAKAVGIDGPHAWRDPRAGDRHGVGRLCEHLARTPGKTGPRGRCYPGTYLRWVELCIAVFDELLARPDVQLAADPTAIGAAPASGYLVLECFPTSTWRASALAPLPARRHTPPPRVEAFARDLARAFALPPGAVTANHDDLQALVAALPAAALLGAPARSAARGLPTTTERDPTPHRVEGFIWDASPA